MSKRQSEKESRSFKCQCNLFNHSEDLGRDITNYRPHFLGSSGMNVLILVGDAQFTSISTIKCIYLTTMFSMELGLSNTQDSMEDSNID